MKRKTRIHKILHRQLKTEQHGYHRCSGRVSSFCSICGTRRVTLGKKQVISYGRGKENGTVTNETFPWSRIISKYHHSVYLSILRFVSKEFSKYLIFHVINNRFQKLLTSMVIFTPSSMTKEDIAILTRRRKTKQITQHRNIKR